MCFYCNQVYLNLVGYTTTYLYLALFFHIFCLYCRLDQLFHIWCNVSSKSDVERKQRRCDPLLSRRFRHYQLKLSFVIIRTKTCLTKMLYYLIYLSAIPACTYAILIRSIYILVKSKDSPSGRSIRPISFIFFIRQVLGHT